MKLIAAVVLMVPLLQGCGLGMLAAGSGASKAGTAQIMSAYTEYTIGMEKINLEREKSGLRPRPILSKEEWLRGIEEPKKPSSENGEEEKFDP